MCVEGCDVVPQLLETSLQATRQGVVSAVVALNFSNSDHKALVGVLMRSMYVLMCTVRYNQLN